MTMSLREQLSNDLKDAMRQRDETRKRTVRGVIAAIQKEEAGTEESASRVSLGDEEILQLIVRQVKQRRDSIEAFRAGNRPDLVAAEEAEMAILQAYLPPSAGRAEIEAEARKVIAEVGASGPRDMGKVMKPLLARLGDQADGRLASQIVRDLLAG
jgi:uncharacterized protein YqeY